MARPKTGYSLKRERGLVPHTYQPTSESYRAGAFKNWPREALRDGRVMSRMARAETPSNNGYIRGHTFVGAQLPNEVVVTNNGRHYRAA